jgi:hypothetical protein
LRKSLGFREMAVWFCLAKLGFAEVLKILERDKGFLVVPAKFGGRDEGFDGKGKNGRNG